MIFGGKRMFLGGKRMFFGGKRMFFGGNCSFVRIKRNYDILAQICDFLRKPREFGKNLNFGRI